MYKPIVTEVKLSKNYKFMYENFAILTQHKSYLFLETIGENTHALCFDSHNTRYGGPNDEAHDGHPLSKFGLGCCGLYIVENSPWIYESMIANRVHTRHSDSMFDSLKHYIACFKDLKFESICREMKEVIFTKTEVQALINQELLNLD
jgi:hypothetical protein